jgi:hypothetical protein
MPRGPGMGAPNQARRLSSARPQGRRGGAPVTRNGLSRFDELRRRTGAVRIGTSEGPRRRLAVYDSVKLPEMPVFFEPFPEGGTQSTP